MVRWLFVRLVTVAIELLYNCLPGFRHKTVFIVYHSDNVTGRINSIREKKNHQNNGGAKKKNVVLNSIS